MPGHGADELTALLKAAQAGDLEARDHLVAAIYDDLHRMAKRRMRRERADHTLQTSALVNEALLRLFTSDTLTHASDRRYLFAAAAHAMTRVLIDHQRARQAAKRGGARGRTPLDDAVQAVEARGFTMVELNDAIDRLAALESRQALVVNFRFFLGMTVPEVAEALDVSVSTVEADWVAARSWLYRQIGGSRR